MSNSRKSFRASVLGIKKVPASVQLLETRLQSYDPEIREQAYRGIFKLDAPDEPLVELCEEQLHKENWFVREAGVNALGHCVHSGCGQLAAATVEKHLEHEEPYMRYSAGRTLVEIEEQVRILVEGLKQKGADEKDISANNETATMCAEMLKQRLSHEDAKIRQNSLDALSRMDVLCIPHADAICAMVSDSSLQVRNELLRVVARLNVHLLNSLSVLAEALGHAEERIRRSSARCLVEMSKTCGAEVANACAVLLSNENRITRITAMELMGNLGHLAGPHGKELAEHLEELDPEVRAAACDAIIAGGKSMAPHLAEFKSRTHNKNPDIVRAAVRTLRGLACMCTKVSKSAHKDLEEEADLQMRKMAIEILGGAKQNVHGHLEEIVKALEDKDWGLRRVAIEALADLEEHAEEAASEVARRLLHHDPDVRRAGAEALGRMGLHAGEYGHRVEGLLDTEEDNDVKETCAAACEMLYEAGMAHGR